MSINWANVIVVFIFIAVVVLSVIGLLRFVFKNR